LVAGGRSLVLPATKKQNYPVGSDIRLAFDPTSVTILP
jgi:hypothetical protein